MEEVKYSIREMILEKNPEDTFLFLEGYDDAILGTSPDSPQIIYSMKKILEILEEEMSYEEALDYLYYNMFQTFSDQESPIICYDLY